MTIVEVSDFQCPFCARLAPTLSAVLKDPALRQRVRLVHKHFPLSFHNQAKPAALASYAAQQQGKFWEYHDLLYLHANELSEAKFEELAQRVGLDLKQFRRDISSADANALIAADMRDARRAGLRGTPTLYINGRQFQPTGGYSVESIRSAIQKTFPR